MSASNTYLANLSNSLTKPEYAMIQKLRFLLPCSLCLVSSLLTANTIILDNSSIDAGLPAATVVGVFESTTVPKAVKIANY